MHPRVTTRFRNPLLMVVALLAVSIVAGCSSSKLPGVYRLDIQQGNVITEEMLDQVQLGMERRKVQFILGTPLLTDPFNQDRWDYLYSLKKGRGDRAQRHVSLFFENDRLVRIEGDIRGGPTPEGVRPRQEIIVTVPAERRKRGFLASLVPGFLKKDPAGRRVPAATPVTGSADAKTVSSSGGSEPGVASTEDIPESISAEDRASLEKLFGDFGRLDGDAEAPDASAGPATTRDAESP